MRHLPGTGRYGGHWLGAIKKGTIA